MSEINRRVLLIDDNPAIHEDFRKILEPETSGPSALSDAKAAFFGEASAAAPEVPEFELDSAFQGQEGVQKLSEAVQAKRPYAMAFVDVRMPPGWDGIQTIKKMWEVCDELQIVICTAYSDYSWDQTIRELGQSERLLILKKPFDSVEIRQLAHALTDKWNTARREKRLIDELRQAELESRSYSASLETMNQALKTAKATADKASELKSDFLVHLSEAVNSNLTTILGHLGDLEPSRDLELVLDSSRHLMRTLDEILDITQMESGNLALEPAPSELVTAVRETVADLQQRASEKGLWLRTEFPEAMPQSVRTDERRFRQVLAELIENGIRYTATGGVCVTMRMEPTNDWNNSIVRCDVIDTGRGVPPELHGVIFEPFGSTKQDGESGNPGLGLAVSKQLARLLGGDIVHEDNADRGTTFTFTLQVGNLSGVPMIEGEAV